MEEAANQLSIASTTNSQQYTPRQIKDIIQGLSRVARLIHAATMS
jgi:hypothetical protein